MTETSHIVSLDMVSFVAAGCCFAIEAARVRSQMPSSQCATATAVEQLLGLVCDEIHPPPSRRVLMIKSSAVDFAVTVSEPVELRSLAISAIYPLPLLLAARCSLNGIRAIAMEPGRMTVLVDFQAK